jgi:tetratricopeptide (TPR) repeat protein
MSCRYGANKEYDLATQYAYKCFYLSDKDNMKHLRSELYHYLGQAKLKGDPEETRTFLDTALQDKQVTQDTLTLASILTTNAEWYVQQQALTEAAENAQKALALTEPFDDTLIRATVLITLGRIEYAQSLAEAGDQHFTAGLSMLERLGRHEELANESVNYAEILEQHGKEREAFAYFRRAFQSQQKMGK